MNIKREIKKRIKWCLTLLLSKKSDEIISLITLYNVISFDVFDTLISRSVGEPEEVFQLLENQMESVIGRKIPNFKDVRIKAEWEAKKSNKYEEITLDEIYEKINVLTKAEQNVMRRFEEEVELKISRANLSGKSLYDAAIARNKRIYAISDMYLSAEIIEKLLINNGYTEIKKVYISSEYGKKKKTGHLFQDFLEKEQIKKGQMLHIGDNPISDGIVPFLYGIRVAVIEK